MEPDINNNMGVRQEGSVGPVIATIIILAVIVLGGLYFWGQRSDTNTNPYGTGSASTDTSAIDYQSNSDDTASIESDLNSTDTTTVDNSINAS